MTDVSAPSHRASFTLADEASANAAVNLLSESVDTSEIAVAAFERPDLRWDVTFYFGEPPDQASVRALVALAVGDDAAAALVFDEVAPKDWVRASLEGLAPVEAGRFMVHGAHDRDRIQPNRIGIEIEAALAFGTGHHGTTRGCLLLLDHVMKSWLPRRVLDLGTGTGVLAIAAAKVDHRVILATDIDWRAVQTTRENARLNGVGPWIEAVHATGFGDPAFKRRGPFDLVLANILANPLRAMATPMARHLAPGAFVILSGLLTPQARGVIAAYRSRGLVLRRHIRIDEWSSLLLERTG